jgi:hypothetical protein
VDEDYFAFNELFFDSVFTVTKSYNCIKSICFHEIAHHFYRHPLKSKWEAHVHELEADRYSGFLMRMIGATLEQSIAAMTHFGNETDTHSHPSKYKRIAEIRSGYLDASIRIFKDSLASIDSLHLDEKQYFIIREKAKSSKKIHKNQKNQKKNSTLLMTTLNLIQFPIQKHIAF